MEKFVGGCAHAVRIAKDWNRRCRSRCVPRETNRAKRQPPAGFAGYPSFLKCSTRVSRWSPWNSIVMSSLPELELELELELEPGEWFALELEERQPPAASFDLRFLKSAGKSSVRSERGANPVMTVTNFPRRCSRRIRRAWSLGSRILPLWRSRGQVHTPSGLVQRSQVTGCSSGVPVKKPDMQRW